MAARKWENQDDIQKMKILKVLKENKKMEYLSIKQIADLSNTHRNTVTKYIPDLEKAGKIASLKVGRWYIYRIK
ncbi:MAG TPA: winged helix-turn-helix domain-containing protein [Candidatus Nitrosotenuis sp.]|nr:winged helix-turn-helix domain-containing protein [Candidatus Nitrosotenuis sp.]